jgi:hypothetical protein
VTAHFYSYGPAVLRDAPGCESRPEELRGAAISVRFLLLTGMRFLNPASLINVAISEASQVRVVGVL